MEIKHSYTKKEREKKPKEFKRGDEIFLNPYNFVDSSAPTPRYEFRTNEKFHSNSGFIEVTLGTVTPLFIPDPEETEIKEIKEEGKSFDHKKMKFFRLDGQPAIPSTSLKGMIRSTIETLSNSCFPHDYTRNTVLNYLSHRLDVNEDSDSKEIRRLSAAILKERKGKWYLIKLDKVKVLTVVDRCCTGDKEDKKEIYFAKNKDGEIEKISVKTSSAGINAYIEKKGQNRFKKPLLIKNMKMDRFKVVEVNGEELNKPINMFNKKFPYINLNSLDQLRPVFYAIIRQKKEVRKIKFKKFTGKMPPKEKTYYLYKLKEVSDKIVDLKPLLDSYRASERDNKGVLYEICQCYLKTSFDMENKIQDRLFFKFGEIDLEKYLNKFVEQPKEPPIDEKLIDQFRNLISQRYENMERRHKDSELFKLQPSDRDIKDGMLVYYSSGDNPCLTYTEVARKPYRYGIADILGQMGKTVCRDGESLCPACNMFGGVNIDVKEKDKNRNISIGGKVSVGFGRCLEDRGCEENVVLKPLGEPKPSFYQFYVLDNRKPQEDKQRGEDTSYDFRDIKLGRKVYLKHGEDRLDYRDPNGQPTKLNSTVELLKPGARFSFKINYFNLSHYELGLLLNSLPIQYNGRRLDYQLGMGKSLGLGRVMIEDIKVTAIDRKKRYASLVEKGERELQSDEIDRYINIFRRIQADSRNPNTPFDQDRLNDVDIGSYEVKPVPDFDALPYIEEFNLLKSINDGIPLEFPVRYPTKRDKKEKEPSKQMKGFKWFMEEKKYKDQRLFQPHLLKSVDQTEVRGEIPLFKWGQECES